MTWRAGRGTGPAFVGVDGCRGGWIAVTWDGEEDVRAQVGPHLAQLALCVASAPEADSLVAVDMPIGLLDAPAAGGRACDRAARALLGARARSVFSPPTRAALAAARFEDAPGISLQCWNIVPRIRELDAWITPALQARVVEAHPELAFARMAGAPMRHAKRSREGAVERRAWLARAGVPVPPRPRGAAEDDLLDACALAWTARRVALGSALRVPRAPPVDARGLRMEIWG